MEQLLENIEEFLESGNENLEKKRYNAAVSDFFKAIVIVCDYLIYQEIKILPKNHNDRFSLLKKYFKEIYSNVSKLFNIYIKSYNLRIDKKDVIKLRDYANELRNKINKG